MKDYAKKIVALFCMSFMLITVISAQEQTFFIQRADSSIYLQTRSVTDKVIKVVDGNLDTLPGTAVQKLMALNNPKKEIWVEKKQKDSISDYIYLTEWNSHIFLLSPNGKIITVNPEKLAPIDRRVIWEIALVCLFVGIFYYYSGRLKKLAHVSSGRLGTILFVGLGIGGGIITATGGDFSMEFGLKIALISSIIGILLLCESWILGWLNPEVIIFGLSFTLMFTGIGIGLMGIYYIGYFLILCVIVALISYFAGITLTKTVKYA